MKEKISYYIFHKGVYDLMQRFLPVIGLVYLAFFVVESILPGTVIEVFNINILLLLFIANAGYLVWGERKNKNDENRVSFRKHTTLFVYLIIIAILLITLFIVQYKISIFESLLYIAFAVVIGKFSKDMLGETN